MEATLYTPHHNQRKIHDAINTGKEKYYVLNIGRQFGKSFLALNQLLYWGLNNNDVKIAWVSPIYKQAKKVFDELVKAFEGTVIYSNVNRSELKIKLLNGSTIEFFSSERYDNIRGFTFDYLICDEFAFMDKEAWTEVLRATVLVKGKKVLLISTPKGKNHFHQLHQLDGVNPQYKSFTMTSYDNPMINPKEIDDARDTLPDHVFRQEYLAEFIDGGTAMFNGVKWMQSESSVKCYAGIDVGRADDYTVLSIFNDKGQMFYCDRWRQMEWTKIVQLICEQIRKYKPETMIEVNSIGDVVYDLIQKELGSGYTVNPFVTSNKSKQDIIERLIVANQTELQLLDLPWLRKEFEVFTYEYNPKSRSVKYSAPNGFHDDGVMATAIAYECYLNGKNSWAYSF